jgi:hypothetical protein
VDIPALLALVWRFGASPALRELLPHCRSAFGLANNDVAEGAAA